MGFFKTVAGSFYSPAVYVKARNEDSGLNLVYSLLLVMISCAGMILALMFYIHYLVMAAPEGKPTLVEKFVMQIVDQVPVMVLNDGKLSMKEPQPYTIYAEFDGKRTPFIVIDTTGKTDIHTLNEDTAVLITERELYIKKKDKTEVHPLAKFSAESKAPLIINRALAEDTAKRALKWVHEHLLTIYAIIAIFSWLILTFVFYILRVIMLLALALVGLVAASIWKPGISFARSVQVAAIAYTPIALVTTVSFCFSPFNSLGTMGLFALGGVMTCIGIYVSRQPVQA